MIGPFPLSTAVDALLGVENDRAAAVWALSYMPDEAIRLVEELIAQLRWLREYYDIRESGHA